MNLLLLVLLSISGTLSKVMGDSFREKLLKMGDSDKVAIIVVMKQGYDLAKFREDDYDGKRKYMMRVAEESQRPVVEWLRSKGEVEGLKQFFVINGFAIKLSKATLMELLERDDVAYVEEDEYRQYIPKRSYTLDTYPTGSSEIPWDRLIMNADKVWNELGYKGEGIVLGIMDTGVDGEHPALKDNWRGIAGWYDAVNSRTQPYDDGGHGTACASIMAGKFNLGVAPEAKWIGVKILDAEGSGTTSQILSGFNWIAGLPDSLKPRAVSNSWGINSWNSTTFWAACSTWKALGIFPIFAEGNEGSDRTLQSTPGTYPTVMAVGATDPNDEILSYSSRGGAPQESPWNNTANWYSPDWNFHKPDVVAPADPVWAAAPGGGYISDFNGTSSATPHVAGEAALILSKNPYLNLSQIYLTIRNNTKLISPAHYDYPNDTTGWGRVDAYKAVINTPLPTLSNIVITGYSVEERVGNNDGQLQPGERIYLRVRFLNRGQPASNVTASLVFDSIPDYAHSVTYYVQSVNIGNLGTGEEVEGTFDIGLSLSAPVDKYLYFTLKISAGSVNMYRFLGIPITAQNYPPSPDTLVYDDNIPYFYPGNDAQYNNYTYFAMRFEAPAPCTLTAIQVYFAGTTTAETLFVWKHNAGYDAPDVEIYGYSIIAVGQANAWVTVNLSNPIYISSSGYFWVGIRKSGTNAVPYQDDDGASTVNLATTNRLNPSSWWGRDWWCDFCMRPIVNMEGVTTPTILSVTSTRIDDSYWGNDDGYIDPGERVSLKVSVKNIGITAERAVGYLYPLDQATMDSVTIVKDTSYFGTIYHGEGNNDNDPFVIEFTKWSGLSGFDPQFMLVIRYNYGSDLRYEKEDTLTFSLAGPYMTRPNVFYWYPMGLGEGFLLNNYPASTSDRYWATFAIFGSGLNDSIDVDSVAIYGYNNGNQAANMYLYLWSHNPNTGTPSGAPFYTSTAISVPARGSQFYYVRPNRKIPSIFWYGQNSRVGNTQTGLKPPFWWSPFIGQAYTLVSTANNQWTSSTILGYVEAPLFMYFKIRHNHPALSYFTPDGWDAPVVPSNVNSTSLPSVLKGDTTVYLSGWVAGNRSEVNAVVPSGETMRNIMFLDNYGLAQVSLSGPTTIEPWYYVYYQGMEVNNFPAGRHTLYYVIDWDNVVPSNLFNSYLRRWGQQFVFSPVGYLNYNTPVSDIAPEMVGPGSGYKFNMRAYRIRTTEKQWIVVAMRNKKYGLSGDSVDLDLRLFDDEPTSPYSGFENLVSVSALGPDKIEFIAIYSDSQKDLFPAVYSFGDVRDSFDLIVTRSGHGYLRSGGSGVVDVNLPAGNFAYVENLVVEGGTKATISVDVPNGDADIALYLFSKFTKPGDYRNPIEYVAMSDNNGSGGSETITYSPSTTDTVALLVLNKSAGSQDYTIRFNNVTLLPVDENTDNMVNRINYAIPSLTSPGKAIEVVSPTLLPFSIKLYDVSGREAITLFDGLLNKGKNTFLIPENLKSGIYFVEVKSGESRQIHQMIVVR